MSDLAFLTLLAYLYKAEAVLMEVFMTSEVFSGLEKPSIASEKSCSVDIGFLPLVCCLLTSQILRASGDTGDLTIDESR